MSGQAGRYQRSAAGMVGAMIVLVGGIIGFVVLRDVNRDDPPSPVRPIDYAPDAAYAREQAGFDVVAPETLPRGWRATTAGYVAGAGESWHLGVLTDDNRYVGLEQGQKSLASMVEEYVDKDARRGAAVDVDGRTWRSYTDAGGDLALVRRDGDATTLVVGHDVPKATLVSYTAGLS